MSAKSPLRLAVGAVVCLTLALSSLGLPQRASATPATTTSQTSLTIPAVKAGQTVVVGARTLRMLAQVTRPSGVTFSLLAVTWQARSGSQPVLQYRTTAGGTWTAWTDLSVQDALSGNGLQGTDPVFTGAATGVDVRVLGDATTTVSGATVQLIDPKKLSGDAMVPKLSKATTTSSTTSLTPQSSTTGGFVPRPTVISRSAWGADESLLSTNGSSCVPPSYDSTIKAVIVHHTAGSNNYTADQSASIVRGIYYYHVVTMGWCDIGYNVLVDKYGQIFEGRHGGLEYPVHGAHATSWNTDTMGISVMMNSSTMAPTAASMTSVVNMIAWKLAGNYRSATDTVTLAGKTINRIARHGDVMSTECPGTGITAYMPTLRSRVAAILSAAGPTPIQNLWTSLGKDAGTLGPVHIVERDFNGGRVTTFANGSAWMDTSRRAFWAGSAIAGAYSKLGFTTLGWPTGNQTALAYGGMSAVTVAKGGALVTSSKGTFWVQSTIWTHLMAHQADFARLGAPTGNQTVRADGSVQQTFTYGTVTVANGTVTLSTTVDAPPPVLPAGFGDRTGDGRADLVGVNAAGQLVTITTTSTLKASSPVVRGSGYGNVNWLAQVPDLNGDGTTEVLLRRTDGTLWLLTGTTAGGFNSPLKVGTGWQGMRNLSIMGDMTGDKRPELLAIDTANNLYRYSFTSPTILTARTLVGVSWGSFRLTAGFTDFTGDGTPDLLAVNTAGELWDYSWQPQRGGWVWQKVGVGWTGISDLAVPGDVNGDGRVDLMATVTSTGDVVPFLNAGAAWSRQAVWGSTKGYLALG